MLLAFTNVICRQKYWWGTGTLNTLVNYAHVIRMHFQFDSLGGTVSGLKPGKCYEFEIVAVNKEGESLATKIQDPVFTSEGSSKITKNAVYFKYVQVFQYTWLWKFNLPILIATVYL